jgi:hypothetical protein
MVMQASPMRFVIPVIGQAPLQRSQMGHQDVDIYRLPIILSLSKDARQGQPRAPATFPWASVSCILRQAQDERVFLLSQARMSGLVL